MAWVKALGTYIHIYASSAEARRKLRRRCGTCAKRTRQVAIYYGIFGWTLTCCRCGEQWVDGERRPRPFERGWRKRNISKAEQAWKEIRDEEAVPRDL